MYRFHAFFMTRRDFLASTAAVIATGFALRLPLSAGCLCGAKVRSAHQFGEKGTAYCPNCGRSIIENRFNLIKERNDWTREKLGSPSWDPAQVPFPNPRLVVVTDKPAMLLAKVRLQGVLNLSSA